MNIAETYNWKDKSILIAEDEEMNYLLLFEALIRTKVTILRAVNGFDAIEKFKNNSDINLILMDVKMPVLNGYEAATRIKKYRNIPIIAQTAFAMSGEEEKSIEAGCDAYISKPIKILELLSLIDSFFIAELEKNKKTIY